MANRRTQIILVLAVLAALVGVALLVIPGSPIHKKATLGLDLQGGIEVVLQANPRPGQEFDDAALDRSENIIRERIDKLGVSEPEVRKQGDNQIIVQLAGVFDADARRLDHRLDRAARALQARGRPRRPVEEPAVGPGDPAHGPLQPALAGHEVGERHGRYYLFNPKKKLVAGPAPTKEALLNTRKAQCATGERTGAACNKILAAAGKAGKGAAAGTDGLPKGWKIFGRPAKTKVITCDETGRACPGLQTAPLPGLTYYYLFNYDPLDDPPIPEMTGKDLNLDGTRQDFGTQTSEPMSPWRSPGRARRSSTTSRARSRRRGGCAPRRCRPGPTRTWRTATSRSCSTTRSARSRRSTSTISRTGSRATTAQSSQESAT